MTSVFVVKTLLTGGCCTNTTTVWFCLFVVFLLRTLLTGSVRFSNCFIPVGFLLQFTSSQRNKALLVEQGTLIPRITQPGFSSSSVRAVQLSLSARGSVGLDDCMT